MHKKKHTAWVWSLYMSVSKVHHNRADKLLQVSLADGLSPGGKEQRSVKILSKRRAQW